MTADRDSGERGMSAAFDGLLAQGRRQLDDLFAGPDSRAGDTPPPAAPIPTAETTLVRGTADGIPFAIRLEHRTDTER